MIPRGKRSLVTALALVLLSAAIFVLWSALIPALADSAQTHAFIWDRGTMRDLNDLAPLAGGAYLTAACGTNDHGQIIATAPDNHSYLLTLYSAIRHRNP